MSALAGNDTGVKGSDATSDVQGETGDRWRSKLASFAGVCYMNKLIFWHEL